MGISTGDVIPALRSDVTGWPWEEISTIDFPKTMPDGCAWPRVTVVTPSYNQVDFIEETIRSVLLQGYPNLEYIIIDGGSTDGSVEIIKKYEPWLTYWVSEPDNGQSDAINKGWQRATGEILAWLNSDDVYMPGTLFAATDILLKNSDVGLVYGDAIKIDRTGNVLGTHFSRNVGRRRFIEFGNYLSDAIPQPTTFIQMQVLKQVGYLDVNLHYAMDYDLFLRIARTSLIIHLPKVQAKMRLYLGTKSSSNVLRNMQEKVAVLKKYHKYWFFSRYWFKYLRYLIWQKVPPQIQFRYRMLRKLPRDQVYLESLKK